MTDRPLTQNQQDLVDFLKDGGMIAIQGKVVKPMFRTSKFLIQRNTVKSLHDRKLLAHIKYEDGWDYYVLKSSPLKSEVYTESDKK